MFFKEAELIEVSESLSGEEVVSHMTTTVWILILSLKVAPPQTSLIWKHTAWLLFKMPWPSTAEKRFFSLKRVMCTPENETSTMQSIKDEKRSCFMKFNDPSFYQGTKVFDDCSAIACSHDLSYAWMTIIHSFMIKVKKILPEYTYSIIYLVYVLMLINM